MNEWVFLVSLLLLVALMAYMTHLAKKERDELRSELYAALLRPDVARVREEMKHPEPLIPVHYVDETREVELQQNGDGNG